MNTNRKAPDPNEENKRTIAARAVRTPEVGPEPGPTRGKRDDGEMSKRREEPERGHRSEEPGERAHRPHEDVSRKIMEGIAHNNPIGVGTTDDIGGNREGFQPKQTVPVKGATAEEK